LCCNRRFTIYGVLAAEPGTSHSKLTEQDSSNVSRSGDSSSPPSAKEVFQLDFRTGEGGGSHNFGSVNDDNLLEKNNFPRMEY